MRLYLIIFAIAAISIYSFFLYRDYSFDRDMRYKANNFVTKADKAQLDLLYEWNFWARGEGGTWYKKTNPSYWFAYYTRRDTAIIRLYFYMHGPGRTSQFTEEFPTTLGIEALHPKSIYFLRYSDSLLKIKHGVRNAEHYYLAYSKVNAIFPQKNPFDLFSQLNSIRDSLGVYSIDADTMSALIFTLSNVHVLIYAPDPKYSPHIHYIEKDNFDSVEKIGKNWYFIKLKDPLDFG